MDISQYITQTRQMGLSDDKIKELLLSQGWTNDQINSSLNPSFLSSPQQISNAPNVTSPKRAGFKLIYVFGPILICTLAWTIITLIEYFLKIDPTHPPLVMQIVKGIVIFASGLQFFWIPISFVIYIIQKFKK